MFGCGFITFAVAAVICAIGSEPLAQKIGRFGAAILITTVVALLTLGFWKFTFAIFATSATPDSVDVSLKPPVIAKPDAGQKDPYDFKVIPPGWQQQWKQDDDDPRIAALEKRCDILAREIERLKTSNAEAKHRDHLLLCLPSGAPIYRPDKP
jgi:hypothetical protein